LEADTAPGGLEGWPPKGGLKISAVPPIKGRGMDTDSAEIFGECYIKQTFLDNYV